MFVVIFRARLAKIDDEYYRTAERLQALARSQYGCLDFVSVTQGTEEIALSYWQTEQQIVAWKNDPVHRAAQASGKEKWYQSFQVEICELKNDQADQ